MGIICKLEHKIIKLNDECKKIIKIIKELQVNDKVDPALRELARTKDQSPWGRFLSFVDFVAGSDLGCEYITMPYVEIELEPEALTIFQFYQNYLNLVLKRANQDLGNTEKEVIENKSILLREILLRIVGTTLRVKIDDVEHGDKMVKFLQAFIQKLNSDGVFIEKRFVRPDILTKEGIALVTDHKAWISLISAMVAVIKIVHAPTTFISTILTYLEQFRKNIARFIIVISGHKVNEGDLSDNLLITTFMDFEKTMQAQAVEDMIKDKSRQVSPPAQANKGEAKGVKDLVPSQSSSNSDMMTVAHDDSQLNIEQTLECWLSTKANSSQDLVIKGVEKNNRKNADKIRALYRLFNKNNFLYQIATHINYLIKMGGWVPILTKVLNIENFVHLIERHNEECDNHLRITPEEFNSNATNKGYHQLVIYSSELFTPFTSITHNLQILSSNEIRSKLLELIDGSISKLQYLENELLEMNISENPERCKLINREKLNAGIMGPVASKSNPPRSIVRSTLSHGDSNRIISGSSIDDYLNRFANNTHINLVSLQISDEGLIKLAKWVDENRCLVELNLYKNDLSEKSMPYIVDIIRKNKHLVHLNLGWNYFESKEMVMLVDALSVNKSVKQLCLFGNKIGDSGIEKLQPLFCKNGFIKELDLGHASNKFNPDKFLREIAHESTLKYLYLSNVYTEFKDCNPFSALAYFIRNNVMIEHIVFSNNGSILDKEASELAVAIQNNLSLKSLDLRGCKLSKVGIEALHEAIGKRAKTIKILNKELAEESNKTHKRQTLSLMKKPHDVQYYLKKAEELTKKERANLNEADVHNTVKLASTYIKINRVLPSDQQNKYPDQALNFIEKASNIIKSNPARWSPQDIDSKNHELQYLKLKIRFQQCLQDDTEKSAIKGLSALICDIITPVQTIEDISDYGSTQFKQKALCQITLMILKSKKSKTNGLSMTDELRELFFHEQKFWLKMHVFLHNENYRVTFKKEFEQLSIGLKEIIIKLLEDDCDKEYPDKNYSSVSMILSCADILMIKSPKLMAYKGFLALNDENLALAVECKNESLKLRNWDNELGKELAAAIKNIEPKADVKEFVLLRPN